MTDRILASVKRVLAHVEIRGPIPAVARASMCVNGVKVTVSFVVPDRETGAARQLERGIAPVTGDDVLAKVRGVLLEAYEHEVEEGLYYRGRRPFEPHGKPRGGP